MSLDARNLIVNNIKLATDASFEEAFSVAESRLKKSAIQFKDPVYSVYRRSIDARKRDDIKFVYSVLVRAKFSALSQSKLEKAGATEDKASMPAVELGDEPLTERPVIVGSGPCGLFCALLLAENGYRPIVLERGGNVAERMEEIEKFKKTRVLNTETNIQFGAGGAGTFSDGKLITRINDGMSSYVLQRFVEFGAPEEILYLAKPHIGTDVLCTVIDNMIARLMSLGAEVRFHTRFTDADFSSRKIKEITTDSGKIPVGALVLALGHSSRDTYETLISNGVSVEAKNFSVGMRIEHLASLIDEGMYGKSAGDPNLGHAEYALSHNTKERGVYTFCMCPGGEVVAAASECGGVVVNGMSAHKRDGKNSNSAVVCSIFKEDYGNDPRAAIEFQRKIERAAFNAGGGDYSAPIITFGDFAEGKLSKMPSEVMPTYMNGKGVRLAEPKSYLPEFVCSAIKNAIFDFDKKIRGFADKSAILTGAETRTSAPLRILRNNETYTALGFENLYPAGEGAGYAGGITSAAIDGIRTALAIMKKYKKMD
ncbi:MAG: hypothetical protein E7673_03710 [Ruminococcaceae bacterium]|nr:hypothetical protein [Oscillospiraceae bacterium]